MISTWVGARGAMSRKATTRSSAKTWVDGTSPAGIAQKRQSFSIRPASRAAHHSAGFVLMSQPIAPMRPAIAYET